MQVTEELEQQRLIESGLRAEVAAREKEHARLEQELHTQQQKRKLVALRKQLGGGAYVDDDDEEDLGAGRVPRRHQRARAAFTPRVIDFASRGVQQAPEGQVRRAGRRQLHELCGARVDASGCVLRHLSTRA
jgi:hypothetical protein